MLIVYLMIVVLVLLILQIVGDTRYALVEMTTNLVRLVKTVNLTICMEKMIIIKELEDNEK